MVSETEREVYRAFTGAQERHANFLIAAAGAAIAFAVTRTADEIWTPWMFVWAGAVCSWGLSFVCGIQFMKWIGAGLYANMGLLKVQGGRDPLTGSDPRLIAMAEDIIRRSTDEGSKKSNAYARAQFAFLIIGAGLYVIWHISQMVGRAAAVGGAPV